MPAILNTAAQRVNASVAGLTGAAKPASQEPGAQVRTTPSELIEQLPTEFGGLTHIFSGGGIDTVGSLEPVNVSRSVPVGAQPGPLGGLVPDVRKAFTKVTATSPTNIGGPGGVLQPAPQGTKTTPLSVHFKNTVAKARTALKI